MITSVLLSLYTGIPELDIYVLVSVPTLLILGEYSWKIPTTALHITCCAHVPHTCDLWSHCIKGIILQQFQPNHHSLAVPANLSYKYVLAAQIASGHHKAAQESDKLRDRETPH